MSLTSTSPGTAKPRKNKTSFRFKVWVGVGLFCLAAWVVTLAAMFHYAFK